MMAIPNERTPSSVASYIIEVLAAAAHTPYIGEPISQTEHSLQCGALALSPSLSPPADPETQVAALLHDIGQFAPEADLGQLLSSSSSGEESFSGVQNMSSSSADSVGRMGHEAIGARFLLALGFPDKVARLVGSHVAAKRYLCAVDAGYHDRLSEASKKSLLYQGGPMSGAERDEFAASPWCEDMCRLRRWDDEAKEVGLRVPGLEDWRSRIELVLDGGHTGR